MNRISCAFLALFSLVATSARAQSPFPDPDLAERKPTRTKKSTRRRVPLIRDAARAYQTAAGVTTLARLVSIPAPNLSTGRNLAVPLVVAAASRSAVVGNSVPEPTTLALLALGSLGLLTWRRQNV